MTVIYRQDDVDIKEGYSDITTTGQLISAGSSMVGAKLTKVSLYASTNSGTISGNATCFIQDSSGITQATIGTADTSSLTSATPTDYTLVFENASNTYEIQAGDRVVITWGDGSDPPNILWLWRSNGSIVSDTTYQYYASSSWYSRDGDISGKFEGAGDPSGGSVLLPPEPAMVRL